MGKGGVKNSGNLPTSFMDGPYRQGQASLGWRGKLNID